MMYACTPILPNGKPKKRETKLAMDGTEKNGQLHENTNLILLLSRGIVWVCKVEK